MFQTPQQLCIRGDRVREQHEEADTRIPLHAKHASGNYSSIVIVAEDTDVFILSLAFQSKINSTMYIKCGSATRIRYIDVKKVDDALGSECVCVTAWTTCLHWM